MRHVKSSEELTPVFAVPPAGKNEENKFHQILKYCS
jgi:hypothetical protein